MAHQQLFKDGKLTEGQFRCGPRSERGGRTWRGLLVSVIDACYQREREPKVVVRIGSEKSGTFCVSKHSAGILAEFFADVEKSL